MLQGYVGVPLELRCNDLVPKINGRIPFVLPRLVRAKCCFFSQKTPTKHTV